MTSSELHHAPVPEMPKEAPVAEQRSPDLLAYVQEQMVNHREEWKAVAEHALRDAGNKENTRFDADDTLHDAWERVARWVKEHPDVPVMHPSAFLRVTIRNLTHDRLRRGKSLRAISSGSANAKDEVWMSQEDQLEAQRLYDFVFHNGLVEGKTIKEKIKSYTLERNIVALRMRLEGYTTGEIADYYASVDPGFAKKYDLSTEEGRTQSTYVIDRAMDRMMQYINNAYGADGTPTTLGPG